MRLAAALALTICPSAVIPLNPTAVCCLPFKISLLCNFSIAGTYGLRYNDDIMSFHMRSAIKLNS